MLRLTSIETRQPQKAPNFSVIWSIGLEKPEIISTTMGKPEEGMSIVSKQNLAKRFAAIYDKLPKITSCRDKPITYIDAKDQVENYNVSTLFEGYWCTYIFSFITSFKGLYLP